MSANTLTTEQLLIMAMIELDAEYRKVGGEDAKREGLHINGIPLVEAIRNHRKEQAKGEQQ